MPVSVTGVLLCVALDPDPGRSTTPSLRFTLRLLHKMPRYRISIPACFGEGGCEGDGKGKSCGAIRAEEERKQFRFPEEQVEPMEVPFLVERVSGVKFDRTKF